MTNEELFVKADALYEDNKLDESFQLFKQGANEGDTSCINRLAMMYTSGEGTMLDLYAAIEWDLKAIELGDTLAMHNLAISYRMLGEIRKSKYWFEKSVQDGDGSSALELAKLYMISDKETEKIKEYLNIAINSSHICEVDVEEAERLLADEANRI